MECSSCKSRLKCFISQLYTAQLAKLDRLNVGLCMTQSTNTQLLSVLRAAVRDPRAAQLLTPLAGSGREVGKSERTCGLTVKTILIVKAEAAHASKVR